MFMIWGLFILAVHLYAHNSAKDQVTGCKNSVNAWFADRFSCSVMEVNCYRRNIQGTADEMHAILSKLEPGAVASLIYAHCPGLEVPSTIQSFHNMAGTEMYNSTLVAWPAESAVTNKDHPMLGYAYFERSNLSVFPDGLLASDFPANLGDLEFSHCLMPEFPDAIATWGSLAEFFVDYSNITQVPAALTDVTVYQLCFTGDLIEDIADTVLANQAFDLVIFNENPLQSLPASMGDPSIFTYLTFERTDVSELPDWFESFLENLRATDADDYLVSGYGSPYCDRVIAAMASDPSSLTTFEQSLVSDVCQSTKRTTGCYPIEYVDPQRVP